MEARNVVRDSWSNCIKHSVRSFWGGGDFCTSAFLDRCSTATTTSLVLVSPLRCLNTIQNVSKPTRNNILRRQYPDRASQLPDLAQSHDNNIVVVFGSAHVISKWAVFWHVTTC